MFKARSSARRLGWAVLLGALPMAASACGLLIGLEDHRAFPGSDAGEDANDPPDALADVVVDAPPDDGTDGCAGTMCNGVCTDTSTSPTSCGACNAACPGLYACEAGVCGNRIEQISAGANHGCALVHDGSIWCWGDDASGQLGIPATSDEICGVYPCHAAPIKVVGLPAKMVQVSAGSDATCALDSNGAVWCWGLNDSLQLGRPSSGGVPTPFDRTPAPVPGLPAFAQVTMGYRFACARLADQTKVYCWGSNEVGGLGNGAMEGASGGVLPGDVVGLTGQLVDVSASLGGHACALDITGDLRCWGFNSFGQLGHDSSKDSGNCMAGKCNSTPALVGVKVVSGSKIAPSVNSTCINGDSGFECWGSNVHGQLLATPDGNPHFDPVAVDLGPGVVMSSYQAGYGTSCVITTIGGAQCWGDDTYGGLGRGFLVSTPCAGSGLCDSKPSEIKLPPGFKAVELATGAYWGMALSNDNRLVAWGANLDARLGHAPGDGGDLATCGSDKMQRCNPNPLPIPHPGVPVP